jgi:hypothetical protein
MKLEFPLQIFEKYSNIKCHENPSSGSRVLCGRTHGQTKRHNEAITVFHNFANALKHCPLSTNVGRNVAVDCVRMLCFTSRIQVHPRLKYSFI